MKYACLFFVLVFAFFSCSEKKGNGVLAVTANRQHIKKIFNSLRIQNDPKTDSLNVIALEKAVANEPDEYKAMAMLGKGNYYSSVSSYELALKQFEQALQFKISADADTLRAMAQTGIGNSFKNTGDYPKALGHLYKALKIFENRNNTAGIARVNAYIGEVHAQKSDFTAAEEHLKIALKILENNKAQSGWLSAAHTLANVYGMSGDYENALKIDEEGLRISDSIKSPRSKASFLDNKANCYMFSGKLDSAQYYFEECLRLDIASGSKKQVADTYSNLGNLAAFQKDFKKAEALTLKSINILKSVGNKFNLGKSYQILAEIYERQGDYKKASQAHRTFYEEYKKSINAKKEASLAEFKILHDTEKKEKQLAENKVELLQKDAEVKQRNNMLIGLSLLVFFILMIGLLIYRQQKLRHRQQEQEHELKTAISQIETQNKLQNQRLSISRDLHDNIGAQLTFIISSVDNIKYAFDIKNTKLDDKLHTINSFAKDTIVELRDTIWAMNNSEIMFEDLKTRIFNFIEKAKEARENVNFKFSIDPELNNVTFGSIPGMNLYRTIQEAVNNALKYADAAEISIEIKPNGNDISVIVTDNGSGYDMKTVEKGYGMGNMEKRIHDIGGSIAMESEVGKGTKVTIVLPGNLNKPS